MREFIFAFALIISAPAPAQDVTITRGTTGSGLSVLQTSPSLVTPALGAATATTLAVGGCTLGANSLCTAGKIVSFGQIGAVGAISTDASVTGASLISAAGLTLGSANSVVFGARSIINSGSADGQILFYNQAGNDFGRLMLGGITSSFPAIKRSGATLAFRLADDSADTSFSASTGTFSAVASDTATTDATACIRASDGLLLKGSGTIGICLGTSSARFKHDIAPLTAGLPEIMRLRPVSYKLNADHGDPNKVLYGFTAEDMQPVLPKLVGLDDKGAPNSADYVGLIPVLVRAVQQQQAEIDALRRKASNDDTLIAELKAERAMRVSLRQ